MIISCKEAALKTIEVLKAQIPPTAFELVNTKIEQAISQGKLEVNINEEAFGLKELELPQKIKFMKAMAAFLRIHGYQVPDNYGMASLTIKWL